jgi:hypothetical protein
MRRSKSISTLLPGSMIWVKSTAAKLVAAPLAAQAGAGLLARLAESGAAARVEVTPAYRARRVRSSAIRLWIQSELLYSS